MRKRGCKVNMHANKVEVLSVSALKQLIAKHPYLDDELNQKDKSPSWDGFIYVYSDKKLNKGSLEVRVPVQIKGINKPDLINKAWITYPAEIEDLRNYYNENGALYFVVSVSDDGSSVGFFYNILTPIKLKKILESVKRGTQKTKNIVLHKMDVAELYNILQQYKMDSLKQGSGRGQIVNNYISLKKLKDIEQVKIEIVSDKKKAEMGTLLIKGYTNLYGKMKDDSIWYPVETLDNTGKILCIYNMNVSVKGKVFYTNVQRVYSMDEELFLQLGKNIEGRINKQSLSLGIKEIREFDEILNDIDFLAEVWEHKQFEIDGKEFKIDSSCENVEKSFAQLKKIIACFMKIKNDFLIPFERWNKKEKSAVLDLGMFIIQHPEHDYDGATFYFDVQKNEFKILIEMDKDSNFLMQAV